MALAGAARIFGSAEQLARIDNTTLTYFAVAGALLLLRKVKSLSFGDTKIELRDVEAKADEAIEEAKTATSIAQRVAGEPAQSSASPAPAMPSAPSAPQLDDDAGTGQKNFSPKGKPTDPWDREPGGEEDDPWKGRFGGKPESNHRRLRADVSPVRGEEDWFRIHLWVESTDEDQHPLEGRMRFFIHDTFPANKPFVHVVGGEAELRLKAWGAFTVGALADDGDTELELDLSSDRSFPRTFRER